MTAPAVKLVLFKAPPQTVNAPEPGVDGFVAAVPLVEPLSAGAPPLGLLPFTERLGPPVGGGWPRRMVRSSAGYLHTAALDRAGRAMFTVSFPAVTRAERDALLAFFRDEVACGDRGGQYGFDLEPDGAGNGVVVVRPTGKVTHRWVEGSGDKSVHAVDVGECEEILAG